MYCSTCNADIFSFAQANVVLICCSRDCGTKGAGARNYIHIRDRLGKLSDFQIKQFQWDIYMQKYWDKDSVCYHIDDRITKLCIMYGILWLYEITGVAGPGCIPALYHSLAFGGGWGKPGPHTRQPESGMGEHCPCLGTGVCLGNTGSILVGGGGGGGR